VAPSGRGYFYQLLAAWGWSSLPWLWLIRQPTLVIHGKDDPIVPIINAHVVASLIPHARMEEIDDGHLFMLTSAEETARLIDNFLDAPS
jgi:pimeloyl-ACP methyl ester carboxylesterase